MAMDAGSEISSREQGERINFSKVDGDEYLAWKSRSASVTTIIPDNTRGGLSGKGSNRTSLTPAIAELQGPHPATSNLRSKRKPSERHLDPLVEVALVESKRKHRKLVQNPSVDLATSDIISTSKLSPSGFDPASIINISARTASTKKISEPVSAHQVVETNNTPSTVVASHRPENVQQPVNANSKGLKEQLIQTLARRDDDDRAEERHGQYSSVAPPPKIEKLQVGFGRVEDTASESTEAQTCSNDSLPLFREVKVTAANASSRRYDKVIKISSRNVTTGNMSSGSSMSTESNRSSPPLELPEAGSSRRSTPITTIVNSNAIAQGPVPSSSAVQLCNQPFISRPTLQTMRKKVKPALMSPFEYAVKLQDAIPPSRTLKFLKGKALFYVSGDMQYAGAKTRGRMEFIVKHGGTLIPEYDPRLVTHIITDSGRWKTLDTLKLKSLNEIPDHIPTVKWKWVTSGLGRASKGHFSGKGKANIGETGEEAEFPMDEVYMHAAFLERFDAGSTLSTARSTPIINKLKEEEEEEKEKGEAAVDDGVSNQISGFHQDTAPKHISSFPLAEGSYLEATSAQFSQYRRNDSEDPLVEFYALAKADRENERVNGSIEGTEVGTSDSESDGEEFEVARQVIPKRGFTCDAKVTEKVESVNQDVVDKLEELMKLHKSKPSQDDRWRAFSYGKCLKALRHYPKRIKSLAEARSIRGVGERTALKIMEIIKTGELRRIEYEKTEDVDVTSIFQGIYGVGQLTAFKWYANGCRSLEDLKAGKGGVKLTAQQEIGIRFYDDINSRMPRSEAKAIFDLIKPRALALDPKLFIEIMGSFRRGKADCGDIDILITRPENDGKTHSGIVKTLLGDLHDIGLITEDLSLPEDWNDLETCYRGLCRLPIEGSRRRRIDILSVPWKARGAALLYYTGDDIFNRAMRYKAGVMGYSLNQKGLYEGVVRDPRNRRVKLNHGNIIASETEEEIFKILGVPWQEPHERVRG